MTANTKYADILVTHIPLHTYMRTYKHIFKRLYSDYYLCSIVFIIVPYDSKTIDSLQSNKYGITHNIQELKFAF